MKVIALDPGREKFGIALYDFDKGLILKNIALTSELEKEVKSLVNCHEIEMIILGNGTGSKEFFRRIKGMTNIDITLVDETCTSEEARKLYRDEHKARGIMRLVPKPLLIIREPYDDYVAMILAKRYCESLKKRGLYL